MTNIRHFLIRTLGLLTLAGVIQGCTVHWDGKIDNNTSNAITLIGDEKAGASWTVSPHEKVNITWKYKCLEVRDRGQSYFFEAGKAPKGAVQQQGMTFNVYLVYHDQQLYYVAGETEEPLKKVEGCDGMEK